MSSHSSTNNEHHNKEHTVLLAEYSDYVQAEAAQVLLKDEGIAGFLLNENSPGFEPNNAVGLLVFESDVDRARAILNQANI